MKSSDKGKSKEQKDFNFQCERFSLGTCYFSNIFVASRDNNVIDKYIR